MRLKYDDDGCLVYGASNVMTRQQSDMVECANVELESLNAQRRYVLRE